MNEKDEKDEMKLKLTPQSFNELDQAVRRWIVTSQWEQDNERYEKLKQQYD
jgi:hypothetical protein